MAAKARLAARQAKHHRCYSCKKIIKGAGFIKIGKYFCCKKCCDGSSNKVCKFC